MRVPPDDEIRALHSRHAPTREAFDLVYTHCRIVCEIAERLLDGRPGLDAALVRAGCLLHDIGVYRLYDGAGVLDHGRYVRHGVLGDELLGEEGFGGELRRFCSHHVGVGISGDDVGRECLPIPVADYLAETGEERLVMYADKFHTKSSPPTFLTADSYAARVGRYGADKAAAFAALRAEFGEPDLTSLVEAYGHALR
jgi:uncharacterized protein